MSASGPTRGRRGRNRWFQFLVTWGGLVYIITVALWISVIVFGVGTNYGRDFRVLGLSLNILGAVLALSPRALRGLTQIDEQLDTILARWGVTFLALGFFQQLVGNLVG